MILFLIRRIDFIIMFLFLLTLPQKFNAQSVISGVPFESTIMWNPGLQNHIPSYPIFKNVKDFGAVGNGIVDDSKALKDAIKATPPGYALLVPKGTYLITSTIKITKGIVLRGEGADHSRLILNFKAKGDGISIEKYSYASWQKVLRGSKKGTNTISVNNGSLFKVGDYIELLQDNDPNKYTEGRKGSYSKACFGQLLQIRNISGNILKTEAELNLDFDIKENPRVRSLKLIRDAGIENLYIERKNKNFSGNNISLINTANCWIKKVWSEKTLTAHVFIKRSYQNEIRESYFHDSHLHGAGGQGYGIRVEEHSTSNLIENNIFETLRHSMLVQTGATGNVFGYNYSKEPFFEEGNNWLMSDISAHGHYANMNLFEGNTVQYILIDNVWGTNGPTTIFRNRIEKNVGYYLNDSEKFSFIKIEKNNPYQNIIGNELGTAQTFSKKPMNFHETIIKTILIHGNYIYQDATIKWSENIPDKTLPESLYLPDKPKWFEDTPWPAIGGDISPNKNIIPAQYRYNKGKFIPN